MTIALLRNSDNLRFRAFKILMNSQRRNTDFDYKWSVFFLIMVTSDFQAQVIFPLDDSGSHPKAQCNSHCFLPPPARVGIGGTTGRACGQLLL